MVPRESRSFDGSGNNRRNRNWGQAKQPSVRLMDVNYQDRRGSIFSRLPNARTLSNLVVAQEGPVQPSRLGLTGLFVEWGQFIDHDLGQVRQSNSNGVFSISIPRGDPFFDARGRGTARQTVARSNFVTDRSGARLQINEFSNFIDGSIVYGSSSSIADSIRSFRNGKLTINRSGMLPRSSSGSVIAGDARASENLHLEALQTLFVREHNRLCDVYRGMNRALSDEQLYQAARSMVVAFIEKIAYSDWLPLAIGQ